MAVVKRQTIVLDLGHQRRATQFPPVNLIVVSVHRFSPSFPVIKKRPMSTGATTTHNNSRGEMRIVVLGMTCRTVKVSGIARVSSRDGNMESCAGHRRAADARTMARGEHEPLP